MLEVGGNRVPNCIGKIHWYFYFCCVSYLFFLSCEISEMLATKYSMPVYLTTAIGKKRK